VWEIPRGKSFWTRTQFVGTLPFTSQGAGIPNNHHTSPPRADRKLCFCAASVATDTSLLVAVGAPKLFIFN